MYNLVIDIGNSLTKAAVFDGDKLLESATGDDLIFIVNSLSGKYEITDMILSSVKHHTYSQLLPENNYRILYFDHNTKVPVINKYKSPETLGRDRIAAVVGARQFIKEGPVLVIDAGTCITFELITEQDEYLGGSIAPGLNMRFKALNSFTGKLPLAAIKENFDLIGNTTETSILSGVLFGTVKELDGMIDEYRVKYRSLKVLITGGDRKFFESKLKNKIFAVPDLVLIGLNKILNYNVI